MLSLRVLIHLVVGSCMWPAMPHSKTQWLHGLAWTSVVQEDTFVIRILRGLKLHKKLLAHVLELDNASISFGGAGQGSGICA
jgi:hypothetical protein